MNYNAATYDGLGLPWPLVNVACKAIEANKAGAPLDLGTCPDGDVTVYGTVPDGSFELYLYFNYDDGDGNGEIIEVVTTVLVEADGKIDCVDTAYL